MQSKKNVFLWVLYDFANSIVSIVFFLYFAQWVVIDGGVKDLYFNLTFTIAAFLLLLTVPVTGSLLDSVLRRISGVRFTTILTAIFYGGCAFFAIAGNQTPALLAFTFGLYFYLLSFTFYTPLLNDIATPERRGRVSGLGVGANYFGQVVGLIAVLPFSQGTISWFNSSPRAETLLPSVIIFFLLALPMLVWFHEPRREAVTWKLSAEILKVWEATKKVFLARGVALFILAYFLFNDAVLTAANNFPLFLQQVWGVSDSVKTYIMLGILITSALGGWFSGIIADKIGNKKTLLWVLAGWVVILPAVGLITNFTAFIVMVVFMGFWFGANWAVSRSMMSYLCPPQAHNLTFAYFGLAERASSFVGPIIWGSVVSGLVSMGAFRYRLATVLVSVFIVLAFFVVLRVRGDR